MSFKMMIVASLLGAAEAGSQTGSLYRDQHQRSVPVTLKLTAEQVPVQVRGNGSKAAAARSDDALSEVNAARAKRGLRPFLADPLLNRAARACAGIRAAKLIRGHLSSDFAHLPAGASAKSTGCGALDPSWGWGTCCTFDNYTYAGAAWVLGTDGKRYMHLFVR